jgi:hypothetical protein
MKKLRPTQRNIRIVDTDSLYNSPSKSLYEFFYFLLEVARRLEIWVAEFINLRVGERITDPDFDEMVGSAKEKTKTGQAMVCTIPIHQPPTDLGRTITLIVGFFPPLMSMRCFSPSVNTM